MSSTATTRARSTPPASSFPSSEFERKGSPLGGAFPRFRSTIVVALIGSVLVWAALPPLALGWLAWVAPIPWLMLIHSERLPGRRPYRKLYFAGLAFWLMAIQWMRLPHPAIYLGWIALSAYLACYLPVFVGLSRVAVHRLHVPLWLAAPVVWTGLELARAHLLTGFLMGSLAHTQMHWTALIQISDLVGEYGVDFVVMLVAGCLAEAIWIAACGLRIGPIGSQPRARRRRPPPRSPVWLFVPCLRALLPAVVGIGVTLGYGHWRLGEWQRAPIHAGDTKRGPRIALIQGNIRAHWKTNPDRERRIMEEYLTLSDEAIVIARHMGDGRPPDLLVWPESMFRRPIVALDPDYKMPADANATPEEITSYGRQDLATLVTRFGTPVLVGLDRMHFPAAPAPDQKQPPAVRYNSAALVDGDGKLVGTYDKIHRVMFGEYIPLSDRLPILNRVTPLTGVILAGTDPVALRFGAAYCVAPTICYETAIPHEIRRQVAMLERRGEKLDALVNLTNDAWYGGSSELDMHLACGVFRAVESRLSVLIAANGGISAWIDPYGRIQAQSPRQRAQVLIADVEPSSIHSWYVRFGDWFAGACLTCCVALAAVGWKAQRDLKKTGRQGDKTC